MTSVKKKKKWRPNYSVTTFCHHSEHRPQSFCQTPQTTSHPCHAGQQQHWNMLKRLTLIDGRRSADVTLTQRMDDLTGQLLWDHGSCLTCIVKIINTMCLSSHDDVNAFRFQQATIFTATLLFQPQLITTPYIRLQMIVTLYKSSVCCFAHRHYFIHNIVVRCKKSSDVRITTNDTLLNLFW